MYTSLSDAEAAKQPHVTNAYLESARTIIAKLTNPLTLPLAPGDTIVADTTTGQALSAASIDTAQTYHAVVVGDLQHLLGAKGD